MKGKRGARQSAAFEPLGKVALPLFREEIHEIFTSISYKIVGENFVRSVRSKAHVLGTDGISFYSAACGRRDSLREGLFRPLKRGARRSAAFELVKKVLQAPALIGAK